MVQIYSCSNCPNKFFIEQNGLILNLFLYEDIKKQVFEND